MTLASTSTTSSSSSPSYNPSPVSSPLSVKASAPALVNVPKLEPEPEADKKTEPGRVDTSYDVPLPPVHPHSQSFHPLMSPVHPLQPQHPLQPSQAIVEQDRSNQALAGLAIVTNNIVNQQYDQNSTVCQGPTQFGPGYQPYPTTGQGNSMFVRPDQDAFGHRYSLPAFPHNSGTSRAESSSLFHPYVSNSEGPIIHHRNSIAGSTLPNTVVRSRRAGSLAMVEDGPFFSNTKQYNNLYNMNQTQSTGFTILGFDHTHESEVPCLIELKEPTGDDANSVGDANNVIGSMDNLNISENNNSGSGPTRLAVVSGFSISITSKIASTEKKIDLIQHTPKRDKGPQNVPGLRSIRGGGTLTVGTCPDSSVVTFERVQFKTATANNGKRRAAQQFYILMIDLYAHTEDGQVYCVASSHSDALVVRGRSPGHYIDNPEGDLVTSPSIGSERRLSNISQHSIHPYHYSGPQSRSHSISAGTGVGMDISPLGLSGAENTPYPPMSPGTTNEYYQYSSQQNWTDASSMSSPASTYDGSAFSSPVTGYSPYHQYPGTHSPHEHSHSSYFTQRQPSFGSITPRLMMGQTGVSPRHTFDSQLEPPMENSYEGEDSQGTYYQSYNSSPSGHPPTTPMQNGIPGEYGGLPYHRANGVNSMSEQTFIKTESTDGYFPYSGSLAQSAGHSLNEPNASSEPTPSSTSASSIASSFGYPVQEFAGMDGQPPIMAENSVSDGSQESNRYKTVNVAATFAHHSMTQGHMDPQNTSYQHQEYQGAVAWS
ncbi:meiosis-specific transcription factor ndt80 [Entomortierella beljakovae]|nr:meiosis-specific transcription factor ndt80 [Entomortierella beljakovae]